MAEQKVGTITHYFGHIQVAAITLEDTLSVGDTVHIKGHTSEFNQKIDSMQLEHESIEVGTTGQEIAIKVIEHARQHDEVLKVTEGE